MGVNYWSRAGGPRMWTRYDARVVREELAVLAAHGCNVTRSFCFWPDFVPEPERLDADVLERFSDFLDAHVEAGLRTIPTFLVGHMSGENWDPAWRGGRDLYRDVWLVSQQAWFAAEIAGRFGAHEAVAGWLVSNEMPIYGGPASSDEIAAWARLVVQAVRSAGATQPVSIGDGAWGVEVTGRDNGYSLRALAPLVDFVGPHSYPMEDDAVRQLLTPAFACELAGSFGKPVVLEEFGVSSDFAADDHAADYYRQVLYTTLLAGARGWLAWCNADFDDLRDEDPYRHHVFELHFGLTDRDGRPKPALHELATFSAFLGSLDDPGFERVAGDAAIVVPEHFERVLPFTEQAYREDLRASLLQGYVAAREADLPVELVRERDGHPRGRAPLPRAVRRGRHRAGPRAPPRPRRGRRDGLRLHFVGSTTNAARALARLARRDLRRPAPAPLRARRPDRGRRGGVRARRDARRPAGGLDARLPCRRRARRPRLPARRARGRDGRRGRRPRPSGAPAPRARRRAHGPLHLSAGAPRGAQPAREPREHLADLLGAGRGGGCGAARPRRRPPRPRRPRPQRSRRTAVFVNALPTPWSPSRSSRTTWRSTGHSAGADARAFRGRHGGAARRRSRPRAGRSRGGREGCRG